MDSLIQISKNTINGVEINSVNARELYNNLGLAKGQYSRWIQNNLIDQFLYNDDYIGVRQIVEGNEVVSHKDCDYEVEFESSTYIDDF